MAINAPTRGGPQFRILGPVEVSHGGVLVTVGGPRHYRLFAVLLVYANQLVGAGRLIEALWGEEPPSPRRGQNEWQTPVPAPGGPTSMARR